MSCEPLVIIISRDIAKLFIYLDDPTLQALEDPAKMNREDHYILSRWTLRRGIFGAQMRTIVA